MNISFKPLCESDFPLMLKWLEAPHVKQWWDLDIVWTLELVQRKYSSYANGYKNLKLNDQIIKKPIYAFIIFAGDVPIGYMQYYNSHDFPPEQSYNCSEFLEHCAGLDWYIGEVEFIGKGIASQIFLLFLEQFVFCKFDHVLVDPDSQNTKAIHIYEKIGFTVIKKTINKNLLMIKTKNNCSRIS